VEILFDARVDCADGSGGGLLCVIFHPETRQVTHVVVREATLPHTERLLPIDWVLAAGRDVIRLRCTRKELGEAAPFIGSTLVQLDYPNYLDTPGALMYPCEYPETIVVPERYECIPPGESVVRRGVRVYANDGYLGRVVGFAISTRGCLDHLIVRDGLLLHEDEISVATGLIREFAEDGVHLNADRRRALARSGAGDSDEARSTLEVAHARLDAVLGQRIADLKSAPHELKSKAENAVSEARAEIRDPGAMLARREAQHLELQAKLEIQIQEIDAEIRDLESNNSGPGRSLDALIAGWVEPGTPPSPDVDERIAELLAKRKALVARLATDLQAQLERIDYEMARLEVSAGTMTGDERADVEKHIARLWDTRQKAQAMLEAHAEAELQSIEDEIHAFEGGSACASGEARLLFAEGAAALRRSRDNILTRVELEGMPAETSIADRVRESRETTLTKLCTSLGARLENLDAEESDLAIAMGAAEGDVTSALSRRQDAVRAEREDVRRRAELAREAQTASRGESC
jgi:hypothetical protein